MLWSNEQGQNLPNAVGRFINPGAMPEQTHKSEPPQLLGRLKAGSSTPWKGHLAPQVPHFENNGILKTIGSYSKLQTYFANH